MPCSSQRLGDKEKQKQFQTILKVQTKPVAIIQYNNTIYMVCIDRIYVTMSRYPITCVYINLTANTI